ncbi:AhpC/TSA family protein [Thozetella sp. PMI_491]|nr:AhpC/TSA family protein [Thozetella sp. PMI_491]
MSFRAASLRSLRLARPSRAPLLGSFRAVGPAAARSFHATRPAFVQVGDELPDLELAEGSPGNKVNLAREASKASKAILIGVPAAFSGACSSTHIPGFINHPRLSEFDFVGVVSVNDAFVMKAWGESLDPTGESGVRFFADPSAAFTKALDLTFDGSAIFGGDRSKRYTLLLEDGKVKSVNVEPDNTGTSVSLANKVLG